MVASTLVPSGANTTPPIPPMPALRKARGASLRLKDDDQPQPQAGQKHSTVSKFCLEYTGGRVSHRMPGTTGLQGSRARRARADGLPVAPCVLCGVRSRVSAERCLGSTVIPAVWENTVDVWV